MIARDFLEFGEHVTKDGSTVMILRTVGPDTVTDAEKANEIYSMYHLNLQPDYPEMFDKLLYNEFVFLEFGDDQEALQFARDNLPMTIPSDADYFIQWFIFTDGMFYQGNNSVKGLTELPYS